VLLAYSARNRSASCRIPIASSPKAKRVEVRFPDPAANPYLGFAAMLMAGIDGIQNKIHPGEAMDKNLYDLPPEELKDVPTVCGSLREAIGELEADHAFLTKGDVFPRDQIESYIELKWEEVYNFEHTPHPIEDRKPHSPKGPGNTPGPSSSPLAEIEAKDISEITRHHVIACKKEPDIENQCQSGSSYSSLVPGH
jgi:hypothetical protein